MEDSEIIEHIKGETFRSRGIKLSDEDPVFALVFTNRLIQEQFSTPIVLAIESLPALLEGSLEKIVLAVEEAENTAEVLKAETKSTLAALAKLELEAAHHNIKDTLASTIETAIADGLGRVKSDVADIEQRIKSLAAGARDTKPLIACVALSLLVLVLTVVFAGGLYGLYNSGIESRRAADYWYKQYEALGGSKVVSPVKKVATPGTPPN